MVDNLFIGQTIRCPHCVQSDKFHLHSTFKGFVPLLECVESNYSGCSVDVARCPECGKGYQVSFTIQEVKHVPSWDGPTQEEREAEEKQRKLERLETKRLELTKLEKEIEDDS